MRLLPELGRLRALPLLLVSILALVACEREAPTLDGGTTTTSAPPVTRSLGDLSVTGGTDDAIEFEVTCPEVQGTARGVLMVFPPTGEARGLVAMTIGGDGTEKQGINRSFIQGLAHQGFEAVVVSWVDPWLQSAPGDEAGPARLACRTATAIRWIHDNPYQDIGAPSGEVGECGFCLTGNSGGASQIGYALSFYGLGGIVDAAVLSGGPPHAALDEGCLGQDGLAYDARSAGIIDLSYGFVDGGGPCAGRDQGFVGRWNDDSLDIGGVYRLPDTRVVFVFVEGDASGGPSHGRFYLDELRDANTPMLTEETIPGTEHTIQAIPEGRAALEAALEGTL
jgi:hypothetical protein